MHVGKGEGSPEAWFQHFIIPVFQGAYSGPSTRGNVREDVALERNRNRLHTK